MTFAKRNQASGFTLLEVLVTVAVLAIALVAILKANVQSLDSLVTSRERTTATLLLASKLAEVEAVGAGDWNEFQGDFGEEYPGFAWEVESEPALLDDLTKITVIVRWGGSRESSELRVEEFLLAQ